MKAAKKSDATASNERRYMESLLERAVDEREGGAKPGIAAAVARPETGRKDWKTRSNPRGLTAAGIPKC
jgi:hypothetical protein